MSIHPPAIRVKNLGKKYTLGGPQELYLTLRDAIVNSLKVPFKRFNQASPDEGFWALKDVSFDVEQGEVVGIIGRNGAGKSTLLKILSRITAPTEGTVELHGRVGSLLEVGTGFHPEMTGRENIFLNGSILGMKRREIDAKLDEIVKFSEIEKFLDTPVKRYSSGMYVRLAFAVAAHMDTEILLVDEVLAVGDAQFQKKCMGKMGQVSKGEGKTVLFVSHNMSMISSLCQKGILLDHGNIRLGGPVEDTINMYLNSDQIGNGEVIFKGRLPGDDKAVLHAARIVEIDGKPVVNVQINEPFFIEIEYELFEDGMQVYPNFHIKDAYGQYVFVTSDSDIDADSILKCKKGRYKSKCTIPGNLLNAGTFYIGFAVGSVYPLHIHFFEQDLLFVTIHDPIDGIKTRLTGYSGPVPGTFRPLLKWELECPGNN
jgi:lipopolysaccharide transport system ATP-binding protein